MPDYSKAYQEALQQARNEFLSPIGVPKKAYEQLLQVYARAILDIDSDLGTGAISEARGEALKNKINQRMIELGERLGILFKAQQISAINSAVRGHSNGLNALRNLSGLSISTNFVGIQNDTLALMMARRGIFGAKNYQSVIKRQIKGLASDIDLIINSAITRGVSAERASQEIAAIMVSKDKTGDLQKLITNKRLTKSSLNKALKEGAISADSYKKARRAFYDSKRIMVTEINTAFREADIQSQFRSPVVKGTKWNLSGRHSVPDLCVRKGTKIITDKGNKNVEDIKIGDKVLTHKGRFKPVIRLYRNTIQEGLINQLCFQAENNQKRDVVMTPNHPVLTDQGWIEAGDLKKDSTVYFACPESQLQHYQPFCDTECKEELSSERNEPLQHQEIENEGLYDEFHPPFYRKQNSYFRYFQTPKSKRLLKIFFEDQQYCHQYNLDCFYPSFLKNALTLVRQALTTFRAFCSRSLDYFLQPFSLYNVQKDTLCHNMKADKKGSAQNLFHNLSKNLLQLRQEAFSHTPQVGIHNYTVKNKTLVLNNETFSLIYQEGFYSSYKIYQDAFLSSLYRNRLCYKTSSLLFSFLQQFQTDLVLTQSCNIDNDSFGKGLFTDLMTARNIPKSRIISNKKIETSGEIVYNFEVEDDHSYTANGLVVHNCDVYADSDLFGMGEGVYPTGNYPGTPHPFCGCYPTAVVAEIEDWGKPKEIYIPPKVEVDAYSKLFTNQTDHYASTQVAQANKYLDLAYEVSKRVRAA
ncbi:MAG: Hint domain-containing protein [Balneola sp.]